MDRPAPVSAAMIERLDVAEDDQHLAIAAGTGEPALSIARRSPVGRVVLTDLVAEMLDTAARRARAQGVVNIETKVRCAAPMICRSTTPPSIASLWTTISEQAIATEAVVAPPEPDGPNMFRCAAQGFVAALYEARGCATLPSGTSTSSS